MPSRIDLLSAPLFVSWQLTRDCNLACVHCCTDSAPGKALPGELNRNEALRLARRIVEMEVPYVMLAGGEPLLVDWFWDAAETLGRGGVQLKVETNGHLMTPEAAARLAKLPIRSVQISLDGDSEAVYAGQRVRGSLARALAGCKAVRDAGLPLEITFAPTRGNIHEALDVLHRAVELGAFRFNTGKLMRIGTAAKLWGRLEPDEEQYARLLEDLRYAERALNGRIELCYLPFSIEEGLKEGLFEPPATLQVLPDGKVKVAAPLPFTCADLRRQDLAEAWDAYREAWKSPKVRDAADRVLRDPSLLAESNAWTPLGSAKEILAA